MKGALVLSNWSKGCSSHAPKTFCECSREWVVNERQRQRQRKRERERERERGRGREREGEGERERASTILTHTQSISYQSKLNITALISWMLENCYWHWSYWGHWLPKSVYMPVTLYTHTMQCISNEAKLTLQLWAKEFFGYIFFSFSFTNG